MWFEMGAPVPFLLQPSCPPLDDRSIADFLQVAVTLSSARTAELVLDPDGGAPSQRYRLPAGGTCGRRVQLDPGPGFAAHLELDVSVSPRPETVGLLSSILATALDRYRLKNQTSILRASLDTTASSILLFDSRGEIVYANPRADRLLSLQTEDALLTETENEPRQPLFSLLCSVVERIVAAPEDRASWKGRLQTSGGELLACEATRLPQHEMRAEAVVVLLQPIGTDPELMIDGFADDHDLSRREHEVLRLVVKGASTGNMADQLGISPHTVRDHIKNLYRKTGTSSRSELVGLLSGASRQQGSRIPG
jgi:DNA-binding CsgD family transcriptional regulator/PAS domain-containing protein